MSRAAELAAQLFSGVKDAVQAVAPGLTAEKVMGDLTAEAGRLGEQGRSEAAAALFSGSNAFVQSAPGQQPANNGHGVHGAEAQRDHGDEGHGR